MKYQFKLNGQVVSAKELYEHSIGRYGWHNTNELRVFIDALFSGKVIELDDFSSDNSVDRLQLVEVE